MPASVGLGGLAYILADSDFDGSDDGYDGTDGLQEDRLAMSIADPVRFLRPVFRYAVCVADVSEQSAYQEAISGNVYVPEGESPDFYIPSCSERHANCKMCGSGPMFLTEEDQQAPRIDLSVLGVCRQLYEEANHLLWATNVFSFDDPRSFGKFFESLNPAQKHHVTSIHISADTAVSGSSIHTPPSLRTRWDSDYWGKGLKIASLKMLRGVQNLHLCINQSFTCLIRFPVGLQPAQIIEEAQQADMEPILRLRVLPLKHVTVVVSDDAERSERNGFSAFRWTAVKKNEYAESIRAQLVDPGAAEIVKAEVEAASLARKIEIRDNAATSLAICKETLKDKRADVAQMKTRANEAKARAVSARKRAKEVPHRSSKRVAKLEEIADVFGSKVNHAVKEEEHWQEQLAKARQKYVRALTRLGATSEQMQEEEKSKELLKAVSDSEVAVEEESRVQALDDILSTASESLSSSSAEDGSDVEMDWRWMYL